jgi:hypothetical protein
VGADRVRLLKALCGPPAPAPAPSTSTRHPAPAPGTQHLAPGTHRQG